ncbi:MAG TPA: glycosyltransferase family 2 protein [Hyphomonadaceae bacterium]|nr:glycosyltransferase family 2 protein [Hyphomonadaceae bacterium]
MDARVRTTDGKMANGMEGRPEFSVVVPVRNEADNVDALAREIAKVLAGRAYELIFVDDSSTDDTRPRLFGLKDSIPALRVLGHRKNAGQSRAVRTGVDAARSNIIVTLDGDGQNDPGDILGLVGQLTRPDAPSDLALVQGRREKRSDSGWKRFGSKVANSVRGSILKDNAQDSGCGARAFRRDAYLHLPYFDHIHRYLPAVMLSDGFQVESRPVNHRARQHGRSNYTNFGRLADAWSDLRGVMWLRRRRRSPGGVDEI